MKFILVDDSKAFIESVKYFLEKIHNHVVIATAYSGEEFLELDCVGQADIILMDIEMPEQKGTESAKKALWKLRNLKIIAVTAYKDKAYLMDLISSGFKACILKDKFYEEFEPTVKQVLQNEMKFPSELKIDTNDDNLN